MLDTAAHTGLEPELRRNDVEDGNERGSARRGVADLDVDPKRVGDDLDIPSGDGNDRAVIAFDDAHVYPFWNHLN
ncbi:hypothetical protein OHO28_29610 [Streptomyces europaeiscabiei]|uniref:hypothetical protein n=1 Tax=Streptomyces europaeiscabiei TaxID=146819 RepID=UPI002E1938C7